MTENKCYFASLLYGKIDCRLGELTCAGCLQTSSLFCKYYLAQKLVKGVKNE